MVDTRTQAFKKLMHEAVEKSLTDFVLIPQESPSASGDELTTRLCFEGQGMKAQAFLSCTPNFLQKTCPLPQTDYTAANLRDWLGELGNLILGRLKNRLLAHGVTIKISAPSFDGPWIKAGEARSIAVGYEGNGGTIGLECSIMGEIPAIGEALKQTAEILPGDAIYRLNDPLEKMPSYDIVSKIRSGLEYGEQETEDAEEGEDGDEFDKNGVSYNKTKISGQPPSDPNISVQPPLRIHFHSPLKIPILTGVSWTQLDRLCLHFSSGLDYIFCPKTLLAKGYRTLELENLVLHLTREGDAIHARIPEYNMHVMKTEMAA